MQRICRLDEPESGNDHERAACGIRSAAYLAAAGRLLDDIGASAIATCRRFARDAHHRGVLMVWTGNDQYRLAPALLTLLQQLQAANPGQGWLNSPQTGTIGDV